MCMAGIPPADRALEGLLQMIYKYVLQKVSTKIVCLALCEDRSLMSHKVAGGMQRNATAHTQLAKR